MPASDPPPGIIGQSAQYGTIGAAAGSVVGLVQAFWTPYVEKGGAVKHTVTRVGSHAAQLGAVAAVFGATEALTTSVRGPSFFNPIIAGCAAGTVMGARNGSLSTSAAGCGLFAAGQFLVQFGLANDAPMKPTGSLSAKSQIKEPREPANSTDGGALPPDALKTRKPYFFC